MKDTHIPEKGQLTATEQLLLDKIEEHKRVSSPSIKTMFPDIFPTRLRQMLTVLCERGFIDIEGRDFVFVKQSSNSAIGTPVSSESEGQDELICPSCNRILPKDKPVYGSPDGWNCNLCEERKTQQNFEIGERVKLVYIDGKVIDDGAEGTVTDVTYSRKNGFRVQFQRDRDNFGSHIEASPSCLIKLGQPASGGRRDITHYDLSLAKRVLTGLLMQLHNHEYTLLERLMLDGLVVDDPQARYKWGTDESTAHAPAKARRENETFVKQDEETATQIIDAIWSEIGSGHLDEEAFNLLRKQVVAVLTRDDPAEADNPDAHSKLG